MENIFRFERPELLYLLFLVPVFILLYVLAFLRKKKALKQYGDLDVITRLMPDVSFSRPVFKFSFLLLALVLMVFAIAGPQFGSKLEQVKRQGVEVVIALDVSNSMLAEDIKPNRLTNAKLAISRMVNRMSSDKIGLIVFAGEAYVQVPITTDYSATKMFLNSINTNMVPTQGTSIGAAIKLAMRSFDPQSEAGKSIIIITDGENHEEGALEAAKEAAAKGIVVHTLGMGLADGSPIPLPGQNDFRRDKNGSVVVSRLNESMMQQVAASGGGIYVRANNTRTGLDALFDEINSMEKTEMEANIYSDYDDRYQYLVALALLFVLLEFIVLERKNKLLKNVKLFK